MPGTVTNNSRRTGPATCGALPLNPPFVNGGKRRPSYADGRLYHAGGFTLVEVMVAVAIIVLVIGLAIPTVRVLQSVTEASAMNILNASLTGVQTYAVAHNTPTALRIQPNGKIVRMYRAKVDWYSNASLPGREDPSTLSNPTVYLPVDGEEPLTLPDRYLLLPALLDGEDEDTAGNSDDDYDTLQVGSFDPDTIVRPVYLCFSPDGRALMENIDASTIRSTTGDDSGDYLVPDIDGDGNPAFSFDSDTSIGDINDDDDVDLVNFYTYEPYLTNRQLRNVWVNENTGENPSDSSVVYNPDTFAVEGGQQSVLELVLVRVPDNWNELSYDDKRDMIDDTYVNEVQRLDADAPLTDIEIIERVRLNPYTGQLIRSQ